MSQILGGSQPTPAQRQVHSDLSSGSDFEFSDLVQSSDSEADASGYESRSYKKFASENQIPDEKNTSSTQEILNQTILTQLEKNSSRLYTLERKSCKTSVDESRIKNKKLKQCRENVQLASSGSVTSLPFSNTAPEASGCVHKPKAKVTHAQTQPVVQPFLLCRIEQGEVTGYDQVDHINCICRANAQKHVVPSSHTSGVFHSGKKNAVKVGPRSMPCQFFNHMKCAHSNTHETRGVVYKHICAHCFTVGNKTFPHTEMDCRNKKKVS